MVDDISNDKGPREDSLSRATSIIVNGTFNFW